jgi:hypothetical protein
MATEKEIWGRKLEGRPMGGGKGIRVVIAIISDNAHGLPIATHGASTIV